MQLTKKAGNSIAAPANIDREVTDRILNGNEWYLTTVPSWVNNIFSIVCTREKSSTDGGKLTKLMQNVMERNFLM